MTNMGFWVIRRFLLSMHSLSCWQGERGKVRGKLVGSGMPNVESGRPRDHRAAGRATAFVGLIPKFPRGRGAGKRKEETRK